MSQCQTSAPERYKSNSRPSETSRALIKVPRSELEKSSWAMSIAHSLFASSDTLNLTRWGLVIICVVRCGIHRSCLSIRSLAPRHIRSLFLLPFLFFIHVPWRPCPGAAAARFPVEGPARLDHQFCLERDELRLCCDAHPCRCFSLETLPIAANKRPTML
ncbi:hypothetical protein NOF04DRAFT_1319126 [Fusarium oxysporum II5]|uniref:Uncharacterized protein n=2 Tax=Fusarium oxysporum species complex TaxID=171631 RepID=N1RST5_FUSC4|nr:hypothetical protein FOC4_g10011312 [Fusarium odoratissimum]KAK2131274.1 hypothetical protein NOF04DRAFT_1319126 [Fusarium oxysporum II5]TXC10069.1 hypothetical protein FocTR4_00005141 [Fusarium oxysporum f. sp. cubense]